MPPRPATSRECDFEAHRPRLRAVAHRILGSPAEAEDAVQETWLRFSRADTSDVENLGAWLTTVVSRVCLNMLEARRALPQPELPERPAGPGADPEHQALLADSVGRALLVVLDTLAPAERVAFVLHDVFAVPFGEIAAIVDRSPATARQLASRARARVRRHEATGEVDRVRHATVVDAFLAAARHGDFDALLALLDPDIVVRADAAAVALGAPAQARGTEPAGRFLRYARGATPALLDGAAAAVWLVDGRPRVVYRFTVGADRIAAVDLIAEPDRLAALDLVTAG